MGDLFWNKVAGVIIGGLLLVMVIREIGGILFPTPPAGELAYPVDADLLAGSGAPVAVETGPVDYGLLLANASASAGERIARRCVACHTFNQGGSSLQGPNLWNVIGRAAASYEGFNFSAGMRNYGAVWGFQNLDEYLENPRAYVPGTAMAFAGIRNQSDRMDLIAYMRQQADNPAPLPDPLPEEEDEASAENGEAVENGEAAENGTAETGDEAEAEEDEAGEDADDDDGATEEAEDETEDNGEEE
ncbi:MAG: cytochrome c family protein [Maricaulaceae bacterium]|nr:cytochrome c family protein [Maricaulaceae bacterium]